MVKGLIGALVALALVVIITALAQQNGVTSELSIPELIVKMEPGDIPADVSTPPPLRHTDTGQAGLLSVPGILSATNSARAQAGLPPLSLNTTLNQAAENKVADMFTGQYFEHVSPAGVGPSDVVSETGYEYIRVGENLALGSFENDQDLVQAWMDSPGHRANILADNFQEIGLAAKRGQFEGKDTWLAVQTFATPLSACPIPASSLQATVDTAQQELEDSQNTLSSLSDEIDLKRAALIALADEIEGLSTRANQHIAAGNELIQQGNQANTSSEAEDLWARGAAEQASGENLFTQVTKKQTTYSTQADAFEELRTDYNRRVAELDALADTAEMNVTQLNAQIRDFNACLSAE